MGLPFAMLGIQYASHPLDVLPPDPATEAANARAFTALLRVGIDPSAKGLLSEETCAPMHRAMAVADLASPRGTTTESQRAWALAFADACEAEAAAFEASKGAP